MVAAAVALSSFTFAMMQTPKFTSTAVLFVTAPVNKEDGGASSHSAFYKSQIEFIRSPAVLTHVAQQLDLADDADWSADRSSNKNALSRVPILSPSTGSIVDRLATAVTAKRLGASSIIEITASAARPDQAHDIAAAISAAYTQTWLSKIYSIPALNGKSVAAIEAPPAAPAAPVLQNPAIAAPSKTSGKTDDAAMAPPKTPVAAINPKEAKLRRLQKLVSAHAPVGDLADELNSDALRSLAAQMQDVETREAAAKLQDGDNAPSVQKVRAEHAWLKSKVDEEVQRALASLKKDASKVSSAPSKTQTMQGAGQPKATASAIFNPASNAPIPTQKQNPIPLNETDDQSIQPRLLSQVDFPSDPARIPSNAMEISAASFPVEPSSPRILPALGFCSALGVFAGLLMSIFVELTDDRLRRSEDVARTLQRAPMAVVPLLTASDFKQLAPRDRHPAGYLVEKPMSTFAEGLRTIRASLLYTLSPEPPKVVAVTSCRNMEGKTAMSLGLARVAAMSGQKVLLIDCDTSQHGVCELLGLQPKPFGAAAWRDSIMNDTETSLEILTWPKPAANARGARASASSARDIDLMRPFYDLIILDAPALLATKDAKLVCDSSDQTVFVTRSQRTRSSAVKKAMKLLGSEGEHKSGLVLNFADYTSRDGLNDHDGYHMA